MSGTSMTPHFDDGLEDRIARLLRAGGRVVLMTIVASRGSTPRGAGERAMLTESGLEGSVGGGLPEAMALERAREALAEGRSNLMRCDLGASGGVSICGGAIDVLAEFLRPEQAALFETAGRALREGIRGLWTVDLRDPAAPVRALSLDVPTERADAWKGLPRGADLEYDAALSGNARAARGPGLTDDGAAYVEPLSAPPVLLLCGGGHVSLETAILAHAAGFVVDVADDRGEFADPRRFPMARNCLVLPRFENLAERCHVGPGHFVAIVTRGHEFDRDVLRQALRTSACYIGMIGSKSKRAATYAALREEGVSDERLAGVFCPIGLPIGAETPQQIAVSIVAELLAARAGVLRDLRRNDVPVSRS